MTHPSAIELEAFACGETPAPVAEHIDQCSPCRAFVDRARGVASARPRFDASFLLASARRNERRARTARWAIVATPLALAAGALLWIRAHEPADASAVANGQASANGSVALLTPMPSSDIFGGAGAGAAEPDTTFKGGVQLAVIRERDGKQNRFTGKVVVRPGDRLRVEVALDRSEAILGAVLGDDGSWLELMPEGTRTSGTHFSEKATRIDAEPLTGTIVVGSPEAVRRVRATRRIEGVSALRVEWGDAE